MANILNPPGNSVKAVDDKGNFTNTWYKWLLQITAYINASGGLTQGNTGGAQPKFTGFTGTVTLAKVTTLGSTGSLTVANGVITAYTPPT